MASGVMLGKRPPYFSRGPKAFVVNSSRSTSFFRGPTASVVESSMRATSFSRGPSEFLAKSSGYQLVVREICGEVETEINYLLQKQKDVCSEVELGTR